MSFKYPQKPNSPHDLIDKIFVWSERYFIIQNYFKEETSFVLLDITSPDNMNQFLLPVHDVKWFNIITEDDLPLDYKILYNEIKDRPKRLKYQQ